MHCEETRLSLESPNASLMMFPCRKQLEEIGGVFCLCVCVGYVLACGMCHVPGPVLKIYMSPHLVLMHWVYF